MNTTTRVSRSNLRQISLLLHRYVGLFLVVFLVVAGLTGSVLAFFPELDAALNPELHLATSRTERLDPFELTERVAQKMPKGQHYRTVQFHLEEGRSISAWVATPPAEWREWFVHPQTGEVLGSREWGNLAEGKKNLLTFLYSLHSSLALGDVGTFLLGIAALLWTIDCFVGAYLTFPQAVARKKSSITGFLRSWLPAWTIKTNRLFSFVFTWHRASGLWIWALLFVFAWSAVGFNLRPVYRPVMKAVVGMEDVGHEALPHLSPPLPIPKLTLREAHERGREEMARAAKARGFSIRKELSLTYADDHGVFAYAVESSLDISRVRPRTEVYIDGQNGQLKGFSAPTGITWGNTVSSWLFHLHTGAAFGLWYRILLVFMGLGVTGLSVTGAAVWWRKRAKRSQRADGRP